MKRSRRCVGSVCQSPLEALEPRQLLSATLLANVPAQSLVPNGSPVQIDLTGYLGDPSLTGGTVVEMQTPLGNIPLQLDDSTTPQTVTNFLQYITNGDYEPTIFQRLSAGFVLQGGGTKPDGSTNASLGNVASESGISNTTGTIAMALSTGPNSGNNQWFINLADNSSTLDGSNDGGPFTVFGNVIDDGMTTVDSIAQLQTVDGSAENSNWHVSTNSTTGVIDGLPVLSSYTGTSTPTTVDQSDLVTDTVVQLTGTAAQASYTAVSADTTIATVSVSGGVLTVIPAEGVTSGSTSVTATVTDLSGETATATFDVSIATPTVSVADASAAIGSSGQLSFAVTVSPASTTDLTLDYSLIAGTAPDSDFSATGSTLTIPAGTTTTSIPVNILADSRQNSGGSEAFTLSLSDLSSGGAFSNGGQSLTATGTILPPAGTLETTFTTLQATAPALAAGNVDTFVATITPSFSSTAPTGTVTFSIGGNQIGSAGVSGGTATLTVSLTAPGDQTVTAVYNGSSTFAASTSSSVTVNVSTLTPTVAHSSLPTLAITGTTVHGTVLVSATNGIASVEKGVATFNLYASENGYIDDNSILIATAKRNVNLRDGRAVAVPIPVKSLPSSVVAGGYTLVVQTVDPLGNTSNAATGPALTVAAPVVAFSESFVRLNVPTSVLAGSKSRAVAILRITNDGNVTSVGSSTIALLASTDGTVGAGTGINSITRRLAIRAGKSVTVAVPIKTFPTAADGTYTIVAGVTDPSGNTSSADYSPTITITPAKIDLADTLARVPAKAIIGRSIPVTIDLANNGNVPAKGPLQIAFSTSIASDGSNPVALETITTHINIKPNGVQTLHLHVPLPKASATGSQYLVAVVDPTNLFGDIDLSNNTAVSTSAIAVS